MDGGAHEGGIGSKSLNTIRMAMVSVALSLRFTHALEAFFVLAKLLGSWRTSKLKPGRRLRSLPTWPVVGCSMAEEVGEAPFSVNCCLLSMAGRFWQAVA